VDANGNELGLPARYGQNDWAIVLGRKNYLFCGSQGGGHRAALVYSLIESAKLNDLDPYAYLVDILAKLPTCRARDLAALLPHRWQPDRAPPQQLAA
jgi:hypothetical protein